MSVSSNVPSNSRGVAVEYGLYSDRDSNLDLPEAPIIPQMIATSKANPTLQVTVEDTTSLNNPRVQTYNYLINHGTIDHLNVTPRRDMSKRAELAQFVATTLDNAQASGAKQTWLELVDHGSGDGGAEFTTEPDGSVNHMSEDDIIGALADGESIHAQRHPEDSDRKVTGVVLHVCFALTSGMVYGLGALDGVRYVAASPETTIAPGIPSTVAGDITRHVDNPQAMAEAVVHDVLTTRYNDHGITYGPAAAFDVLDINRPKMDQIEEDEAKFNAAVVADLKTNPALKNILIEDASAVQGMQRDDPTAIVPWRADRPAIALYFQFSSDPRLPPDIRDAASAAVRAYSDTVLAHGETRNAIGFGKDYTNAIGPTTRFPVRQNQIDPLSPEISETACAYAYSSGANDRIQAMLLRKLRATNLSPASQNALQPAASQSATNQPTAYPGTTVSTA